MDDTIDREQTAADLRAAADVIREHGWTQGAYVRTETKACCMVGAIEVATGCIDLDNLDSVEPATEEQWERREAAYFALFPHARPGPTIWNDAFGRLPEQVIEKLEQVAAELEKQEAQR